MTTTWADIEDKETIEKWRNEKIKFVSDGIRTVYVSRRLIAKMLNATYPEQKEIDAYKGLAHKTLEELGEFFDMCPRCVCPAKYCCAHC